MAEFDQPAAEMAHVDALPATVGLAAVDSSAIRKLWLTRPRKSPGIKLDMSGPCSLELTGATPGFRDRSPTGAEYPLSKVSAKSAAVTDRHIGGFIFSTFIRSPVGWTMMPSSRMRSQIADVSATAGSSVTGSRTSSTPIYSPQPLHRSDQRMTGGDVGQPRTQVIPDHQGVVLQALAFDDVQDGRSPTTHDTGLPPAEEKK